MEFEIVLLTLAAAGLLLGCQGMYVAGDAGPHSTRANTEVQPLRNR